MLQLPCDSCCSTRGGTSVVTCIVVLIVLFVLFDKYKLRYGYIPDKNIIERQYKNIRSTTIILQYCKLALLLLTELTKYNAFMDE